MLNCPASKQISAPKNIIAPESKLVLQRAKLSWGQQISTPAGKTY